MLSPFIHLTHSALIKVAAELDNKEIKSFNKINVLSNEDEQKLITSFRKSLNGENENSRFINKLFQLNLGR